MFDFLPVALDIFGGLTKSIGAYQTGKGINKAAKFEALQYEQNANKVQAASQREAQEEVRQSKLVQSRILAVAAASGGGASDPTIQHLIGKQAGEGAYRAALAIYRGDDRAQQMRTAAAAKRLEGKQAQQAGMAAAIGGVLKTAGKSMYDIYGQGGPAKTDESTAAPVDDIEWWGDGGWK